MKNSVWQCDENKNRETECDDCIALVSYQLIRDEKGQLCKMAAIHLRTFSFKPDVAPHKVPHEACITQYEATSAMCHWAMNK